MYSINDDSLITCIIHPTTKNEQNEELWKDDLALIAMNGEGGEACEAAEGWQAGEGAEGVFRTAVANN